MASERAFTSIDADKLPDVLLGTTAIELSAFWTCRKLRCAFAVAAELAIKEREVLSEVAGLADSAGMDVELTSPPLTDLSIAPARVGRDSRDTGNGFPEICISFGALPYHGANGDSKADVFAIAAVPESVSTASIWDWSDIFCTADALDVSGALAMTDGFDGSTEGEKGGVFDA